jgi:hypothetical protein
MYERALQVNPRHCQTLCNYAGVCVALHACTSMCSVCVISVITKFLTQSRAVWSNSWHASFALQAARSCIVIVSV